MRARLQQISAAFCALLVSACAHQDPDSDPHACTDMGAFSGITVQYDAVAQHHPNARLEVKACLDSACQLSAANRKGYANAVILGQKTLDSERARSVKLTIRNADGRVEFDGATTVRPRRHQVNGAGCPPITWSSTVTAFGHGRLVVAKTE